MSRKDNYQMDKTKIENLLALLEKEERHQHLAVK